MARWQPDARGRLTQAAMELYGERGYDRTTVAEIAERAGLTKRTFFRHFADKREVLFSGSEELAAAFTEAIAAAPADATPLAAVTAGLDAVTAFFDDRREHARFRQKIVDAHPELQERELIKLARLTQAIAAALRARGVGDPTATLAAEAGISVFHVTFQRWVAPGETRTMSDLAHDSLAELRAVAA
jgi:AcrR family transcriptional regulator